MVLFFAAKIRKKFQSTKKIEKNRVFYIFLHFSSKKFGCLKNLYILQYAYHVRARLVTNLYNL